MTPATIHPSPRRQLFELLLLFSVLFLILSPPFLDPSFEHESFKIDFATFAVVGIVLEVLPLWLVLHFLRYNKEPLDQVGFVKRHVSREFFIGLILSLPISFSAILLYRLLVKIGLSVRTVSFSILAPRGFLEMLLASIFVLSIAISEEAIFRGYLILRFEFLTGRTAVAVLLSSFFFGLSHSYFGYATFIETWIYGVILGILYLRKRNLTAPVVIHFLHDFFIFAVLPHLGYKWWPG
jgi:membrane protease YdiL (CAAX protease family)